ncbi:hypothetical protein NYE48_28035 [Paenibacillus sp. FSL M7-1455]|uniref:hypothetical protein n=1 Tax=Paenibacillus sp. FSL M7-1455 TaxID=2975316 RepID=UPI0030F9A41A
MAKLNVVIPAVEVEVNGQKYRKVEREAKTGDIVKITDFIVPDFIEDGGFYEVVRIDSCGYPQIFDEDGDECYLCKDAYEVYEKVAEPATPQYRKVMKEEYEEATKPKPNVSVGDKVRIIRYQCNWTEGTIVTITEPDVGGVGKTARAVSEDGRIFLTDYDSFELLSAEELAQIAEEAKWAKIGRKVNEFKRGDLVRVLRTMGASSLRKGQIVEVAVPDGTTEPEVFVGNGGTRYAGVELIIPVEQRFDLQKEAA